MNRSPRDSDFIPLWARNKGVERDRLRRHLGIVVDVAKKALPRFTAEEIRERRTEEKELMDEWVKNYGVDPDSMAIAG